MAKRIDTSTVSNEALTQKDVDTFRDALRGIYAEIPLNKIYLNSRSEMRFSYKGADGKIYERSLDPMVSSVIASALVPKACVLYRGGHGGGKTSMVEAVSSRLFSDVPRDDIVAGMIRGNDDQNVNTMLASFNLGKLLTTGEEEVRWRKFVTCPVKLIDEINRFPPTSQNGLFELINIGRAEYAGQVYPIHDFSLFATENPNDVGTYPMSRPFLDRFGLCIPAPQLPSAEDLMALSGRMDDKIYQFAAPRKQMTMKETEKFEKWVADNVKLTNDALLFSIYLALSSETCARADFNGKSHCELGLEERCKGCEHDTATSLCKYTKDGFSGRAFLELQRWGKAYSFLLNAFEKPEQPEVQMSMIESIAPYVLYHRVEPNDAIFTKDPFWGRKLVYIQDMVKKAREGFASVREPLSQLPQILAGKLPYDQSKLAQVKKDLVVTTHFQPVAEAAGTSDFRAIYNGIEEMPNIGQDEMIELEKTLTFGTDINPRARAFLRSKAEAKMGGAQTV